jgi:hypothetical protein
MGCIVDMNTLANLRAYYSFSLGIEGHVRLTGHLSTSRKLDLELPALFKMKCRCSHDQMLHSERDRVRAERLHLKTDESVVVKVICTSCI